MQMHLRADTKAVEGCHTGKKCDSPLFYMEKSEEGEKMEQFQCINRVWVSGKGKILDKILWICGWIYLAGITGMLFMGEADEISIPFVCFIIIIMIWSRRNKMRSGAYVESVCILTFSNGNMLWEYPQISMGKEICSVQYSISQSCIQEVAYSSQMQSVRIVCRPQVKITDMSGKIKEEDYLEKKKDCILILYNERADYAIACLQKYLGINIYQVD